MYHILVSTFFSGCITIWGEKGLFLLPPGLQASQSPSPPWSQSYKTPMLWLSQSWECFPPQRRGWNRPRHKCSLEILRSTIKWLHSPFALLKRLRKLVIVVKPGQQCSAQNSSSLSESFEEINYTRSPWYNYRSKRKCCYTAMKLILTYIQLFGNKAIKLK